MRPFPPIRIILGALTAFLVFSTGAYISQLASTRAQADALIQPFIAALKSQDDLAALDWAKTLEETDQVQAFQIRMGSRVIAVGGNQDRLAWNPNCGPYLRLPRTYLFTLRSQIPSQGELTGAFIINNPCGPAPWGLAGALCFLLGAWAFIPVPKASQPPQAATSEVPQKGFPIPKTDDWITQALTDAVPGALVILDESWNIRFISKECLKLFGLTTPPAQPVHLVEWNPEPQLVQIIESGKPGLCPGGFARFPQWLLEVKPIPNGGWTLRLTQPQVS